jgi:hypothetical protein
MNKKIILIDGWPSGIENAIRPRMSTERDHCD